MLLGIDGNSGSVKQVDFKRNGILSPKLENKLRQNNESNNSETLRQTYQLVVKMATTTPNKLEGFEVHVVEVEPRGALPLTTVTLFWLAVMSTL